MPRYVTPSFHPDGDRLGLSSSYPHTQTSRSIRASTRRLHEDPSRRSMMFPPLPPPARPVNISPSYRPACKLNHPLALIVLLISYCQMDPAPRMCSTTLSNTAHGLPPLLSTMFAALDNTMYNTDLQSVPVLRTIGELATIVTTAHVPRWMAQIPFLGPSHPSSVHRLYIHLRRYSILRRSSHLDICLLPIRLLLSLSSLAARAYAPRLLYHRKSLVTGAKSLEPVRKSPLGRSDEPNTSTAVGFESKQ